MKNYVQPGSTIEWTNGTGANVVSGQPVVIGKVLGVACGDIANGGTGSVAIEGVFTLPKTTHATDQAFTAGESVVFVAATKKFSKTGVATGDFKGSCIVVTPAASTDGFANIKINTVAGTVV